MKCVVSKEDTAFRARVEFGAGVWAETRIVAATEALEERVSGFPVVNELIGRAIL